VQRGSGQIEKHRAKARKDVVVGATQVFALHVGHEEGRVCDPCLRRFACSKVNKIFCAIDACCLARRTDLLCDELSRGAEAASYIQHLRPDLIGSPAK
jgi:hypothetical protein